MKAAKIPKLGSLLGMTGTSDDVQEDKGKAARVQGKSHNSKEGQIWRAAHFVHSRLRFSIHEST